MLHTVMLVHFIFLTVNSSEAWEEEGSCGLLGIHAILWLLLDTEKAIKTHYDCFIVWYEVSSQWRYWKFDKHVIRWGYIKWSGNSSLSFRFQGGIVPRHIAHPIPETFRERASSLVKHPRVCQSQQHGKASKYLTAFFAAVGLNVPFLEMEKYRRDSLKEICYICRK